MIPELGAPGSVFLLDRHGDGTATLTMNRPEKLNAMTRAYFEQLRAVRPRRRWRHLLFRVLLSDLDRLRDPGKQRSLGWRRLL